MDILVLTLLPYGYRDLAWTRKEVVLKVTGSRLKLTPDYDIVLDHNEYACQGLNPYRDLAWISLGAFTHQPTCL